MSNNKTVSTALILLAVVASAGIGYATRSQWLSYLPAKLTGTARPSAPQPADIYTCTMHPQVVRSRFGDCPICGMSLVKKKAAPVTGGMENMSGMSAAGQDVHAASPPNSAMVTLDPRQIAVANVATTVAATQNMSQDIIATGRIAVNEQSIRRLTSRYAGRIDRLAINYTGEVVRKGQLVMSIYSPELIATQKEFLIARESAARMKSSEFPEVSKSGDGMVAASRMRMRLWGMTDAQIDTLARTGTVKDTIDVYAPSNGTVTELKVRQGDYVAEGGEIYTLTDLSRVWMLAEVYEYEFSKVSLGSRVEVTTDAYPGVTFAGKVAFIEPTLNAESRTIRLRVELSNPKGRLKPEMFVNAKISSRPVSGVSVPASAVLYTGLRNLVWVEVKPGTFERREVQLGLRSGDNYQVLAGINPGDRVVTQGGFLIDSEAQLRESAGGAMPGMDMTGGKPGAKASPPVQQAAKPTGKSGGDMKGMPGM